MKNKGFTLVEFLVVLGVVVVVSLVPVLALWTDRNIDFWMTFFKGAPVNCPYWLSLLITIIGNAFILAANIIGELLRLIVQ